MSFNNYDDIINLPHHISTKRSPMPRSARAAQFAPFAALTGYEDEINEAARRTDDMAELYDDEKYIINERLQMLCERIAEAPEVEITYFKPDETKSGGIYVDLTANILKIDQYAHKLYLSNGVMISFDDIYYIELR